MRFAHAAAAAATVATLALFAGCSEPVPQTPDGAFWLTTIQPDAIACHIAGHTDQVGTVDSKQHSPVVTDGTDGIVVDCSVSSIAGNAAAPFQVYAKLDATTKTGNYLELNIASITAAAKIDAPAVGTLVFSDPKTAGNGFQGNCNFYFEGGAGEGVSDGKIWVSFQCDGLVSAMSTCPVKQGYAIFENCLTTPPAQ
jgi:hypothetical protein